MFKKLIYYFSNRRKEKQLVKYLSSIEGKQKLAEALTAPIRQKLDYVGVARRALVVDPLPEGALPDYGPDYDLMPADPTATVTRETFPMFELGSTIHFEEIKGRQFNVVKRQFVPHDPQAKIKFLTALMEQDA
jgi:hypothetical protein